MGNFIVYSLVCLSFIYVIYYLFLQHYAIKEYSKIMKMYLKSVEKNTPIEFPSFHEISFDISYAGYRKAKDFNNRMKEVYESIEKL